MKNDSLIEKAADAMMKASYLSAFTGAGISVESGVPPFRGENGLWNSYDPSVLELSFFRRYPEKCWPVIREIFYDHFSQAKPNAAHLLLAELEERGMLKALITQNIDDLHYRAGSRRIIEYHGNSRQLICSSCGTKSEVTDEIISRLPARCDCGGIYKPDFVFFGEAIPAGAMKASQEAAYATDCMVLIGTTGEVYPAAMLPQIASRRGAVIIEINPAPSNYTDTITDIYLPMKAVEAGERLRNFID